LLTPNLSPTFRKGSWIVNYRPLLPFFGQEMTLTIYPMPFALHYIVEYSPSTAILTLFNLIRFRE